jgi:polyhydroxybutyrate depolymerase
MRIRAAAILGLLGCAVCIAAHAGDARVPARPADTAGPTVAKGASYVSETRSIMSGGTMRSFVLARPSPYPVGVALPLVFSLHGDGGNGAGMRGALPLEAQAATGAVFVYPNAADGSTFEYYTFDGRTREATFVQDMIAAMSGEFGVDTQQLFIAGFSGGATMANALGCRLGANVIRAVAIHSGTLYPVDNAMGMPDFDYTGNGGVSCDVPPAIFIWGTLDNTPGVSFADGQAVRNNYLATFNCPGATAAWTVAGCVEYTGCARTFVWCPIAGLGHSIWSGAASAVWAFAREFAVDGDLVFDDGFE